MDAVTDGGTVTLAPGNYGTLYIRQTNASQSVDFTDWAGDTDVERYRALENVTIQAAEGAEVKVERIVVEAQSYNPTSEHSNVVEMEYLNSFIALNNVVVKGINFTATNGVAFDVHSKHVDINGLTLENCTAVNGATLVSNDTGTEEKLADKKGSGIEYTRQNKDITVSGCTVIGAEFGIKITGVNGLTITGNTFKNVSGQNIMLNKNDNKGIELKGAVTITNNSFDNAGERVIRVNGSTGVVTINDNIITNHAGEDTDFIKVSAYSGTVTGENNIVVNKCNFANDDENGKVWSVSWSAAHSLSPVEKVEPTYSAPGMQAHDKCAVCGKLYVDGVEKTASELTIPQLVYVPSYSGGGGGAVAPSTPKVETETTVTPSGTKVETTTETTAEGTKVETVTTTTASGETSTTVTATLQNGSAVTNNDAAVDVEVEKVSYATMNKVEEAVAADDNVEVVGTVNNAISVSATNASTGAVQESFTQPMSVSVPVNNSVLNSVEDTSKLTLAKVVTNADGTTSLEYMGGSYDEETGTFNAKVDEDGDYILVEKSDLVKIELTIGSTDVLHNDQATKLDVAPTIDAAVGRTELPLRYLGEALGFGIDWDNNVVTITKDGVSFSLTIGQEIPGYGTPYIDSDRTMVSARYISEMLGANVIWDPVDRQVIVVK